VNSNGCASLEYWSSSSRNVDRICLICCELIPFTSPSEWYEYFALQAAVACKPGLRFAKKKPNQVNYSLVMCLCILDSYPFALYLGEDKQIELAQIIVLVLFSGYLCISTFCFRRNLGFSLLRGTKEDRV